MIFYGKIFPVMFRNNIIFPKESLQVLKNQYDFDFEVMHHAPGSCYCAVMKFKVNEAIQADKDDCKADIISICTAFAYSEITALDAESHLETQTGNQYSTPDGDGDFSVVVDGDNNPIPV